MKTIRVSDPEDVTFPLDRETYYDPAVYYHGTSRAFSSSIEKDGFKRNAHVYDKADFVELFKAYDSPYFHEKEDAGEEMKMSKEDLVWILGGAGDDMKDAPLSFSGNYWTARNYSTRCGGEAIDHAVKMAMWITELPDCPHQRIAEKILKKYGTIFDNHVPCVYTVRLPDEEMEVRDGLDKMLEENYDVPGKTSDSNHFIKNDIPKESIIARIDLSKEIKHWGEANTFNIPKPVPWD